MIFDLGGVVMPSPLGAFREYEAAHGLPHRFISEVVVSGGDDGAWSRLERGELTLDTFSSAFEAECAAAGGTVVTADLLAAMHSGSGPHPAMVTAIGAIRAHGLRTAALTNNWPDSGSVSGRAPAGRATVVELFDVVVESALEGLRKPDVRIYELICARLEITPPEAAFLDDLGTNLKTARAMGMTTIKVVEPETALAELEQILGFSLGGPPWS